MNFIQPLYLWALAGISVPVAIHLLSRREGKVVRIGSLRHVGESNTSRFKSLRLNEIWLLLARCMMIAWLALLLSGAQCSSGGSKASSKWLLIEHGMHRDKNVIQLIDSLTREEFELRCLAEGFPLYDEDDSVATVDYWGLADELRARRDHEIIVLSYSLVNRFAQKRISRPSNVLWISVDPGDREFAALARRINPDSIAIRLGKSDATGTTYSHAVIASHVSQNWVSPTSTMDSILILPIDTIKISVIGDDEHNNDARMLRAALNVIEKEFSIRLSETKPENADWTFWLSPGRPLVKPGGNLVLMIPQPSTRLIHQTSHSEWSITRHLTPDEAVGSHLVTELAVVLLGQKRDRITNDVRSMPDKMIWAQTGDPSGQLMDLSPTRDLSTILALLFLLTWIVERLMALRKNL